MAFRSVGAGVDGIGECLRERRQKRLFSGQFFLKFVFVVLPSRNEKPFLLFLPTKSVTKKKKKRRTNVWQKYKVRAGFEPWSLGRKANTIAIERKRILPNVVVRYCI